MSPLDYQSVFDPETLRAIAESRSSSDPHASDITMAKYNGLKQIYQKILLTDQAKSAYREFFNVLLKNAESENPGAVLWHCSQGKDRAGLASALLLTALGADDATIRRDYSFTCQSYEPETEELKLVAEEHGLSPAETRELVALVGNAYPEYLQLALNSIYDEYGSLEGYLLKALNLTQAELKTLQDAYLE